jgi:hypothetical protein
MTRGSSKSENTLDHPTIGQLDLRRKQELGGGHHSHVFLAPLTLPSRAGPTNYKVAVKVATDDLEDKRMLQKEAEMYNDFPRELQKSTRSSPPVVPRFYGYYEPSFGERKLNHFTEYMLGSIITPMLLLEPCGKEIRCKMLSKSDR